MVTQLQPDVRAYLHGAEVIKRFVRVEEVASEYGFNLEETEYIARAASALYKLTRIHLIQKERFDEFMRHACQFYIDHYGEEQFMEKKERKRESYISVEDIDEIKAELIEVAMNEARKEVIKLLGGVISGMNVGQSVIRPSTYNKDEEPTEDVMDDADVAGLAMSWMSKGD